MFIIQVWSIDEKGFFIESRFINDVDKTNNDICQGFRSGFVKPKWNGQTWIEGATDEEIQAWEEENKVVQEPSENDILISNILLENAELKQKTGDLEELTSTLMLQIAELKGGSTNV